jgi:alkanesulfonate monooxygenase SsuD/methylene tetrahydromethanopterin reductase-like flavin-dependent oxidoreductase (luciferase family)
MPNMAEPATIVELAVLAESSGFDGVFLWDHVRYMDMLDLPVVDPWVVLGAIAQATSRVRLGTLVTPISRRRPWRVAQEVATLDHLSGGRAVLGSDGPRPRTSPGSASAARTRCAPRCSTRGST